MPRKPFLPGNPGGPGRPKSQSYETVVRGSVASIRHRARNIVDDALRVLEGRLDEMDTETLVKVLNAVRPLAARPLASKPAPPPQKTTGDVEIGIDLTDE